MCISIKIITIKSICLQTFNLIKITIIVTIIKSHTRMLDILKIFARFFLCINIGVCLSATHFGFVMCLAFCALPLTRRFNL